MTSPFLFPRHTKSDLPIAVAGDGPWLIDSNGERYLDGCGGAAVSCLGYSSKPVIDAVKAQIDKMAFAHSGFFTSDSAEELGKKLAQLAPSGIDRVYLVSGGSEAVEASIKLARQYFLEKDEPQRSQFIARRQSYHGNTIGALSAGGNEWRRAQFTELLSPAMHHVDACHYWRLAFDGETEQDYATRAALSLEHKILELGPENVAAFIAEPVVGATMGAVTAPDGYFKLIREICDRHGILLILDEVMCGMGRTGTLFASEHDGIRPDIVCIAKGLGAGYQPIGAMLCSAQIYNTIETGSGFFQHGHTYMAHATASAASVAVIDEIYDKDLLTNVKLMGAKLKHALNDRFDDHPNIGEIRGRGLFLGLEIVENKKTKAPFAPQRGIAAQVKKAAMQERLMCYPMSGTLDGRNGDHILLAPAFIIDETHVTEIVDRLSKAIDKVLAD